MCDETDRSNLDRNLATIPDLIEWRSLRLETHGALRAASDKKDAFSDGFFVTSTGTRQPSST